MLNVKLVLHHVTGRLQKVKEGGEREREREMMMIKQFGEKSAPALLGPLLVFYEVTWV